MERPRRPKHTSASVSAAGPYAAAAMRDVNYYASRPGFHADKETVKDLILEAKRLEEEAVEANRLLAEFDIYSDQQQGVIDELSKQLADERWAKAELAATLESERARPVVGRTAHLRALAIMLLMGCLAVVSVLASTDRPEGVRPEQSSRGDQQAQALSGDGPSPIAQESMPCRADQWITQLAYVPGPAPALTAAFKRDDLSELVGRVKATPTQLHTTIGADVCESLSGGPPSDEESIIIWAGPFSTRANAVSYCGKLQFSTENVTHCYPRRLEE